MGQIQRPSEWMLVCDSSEMPQWGVLPTRTGASALRHMVSRGTIWNDPVDDEEKVNDNWTGLFGEANVLFLDGHVETVDKEYWGTRWWNVDDDDPPRRYDWENVESDPSHFWRSWDW